MTHARQTRCRLVDACARLVFAAALALCGTDGAQAQGSTTWNTIGPAGGTVTALLVSPLSATTVYAATPENGVFVSGDAGRTWAAANHGLAPTTDTGRQSLLAVAALVTDGQTLYAATGSGLYYASLGTPLQWQALAAPANAPKLTLLAYDPSSQRLFAAGEMTDGINAASIYATPVGPSGAPTLPSWSASPLPAATIGYPVGGLAIVPPAGPTAPASLLVAAGTSIQAAPILGAAADLVWNVVDPTSATLPSAAGAITYSADFSQAYTCSANALYRSGNPLDTQPVWLPATVAGSGMAAFNCTGFLSVPILAGGLPNLLLGTDQGAFTSSDGDRFDALAALPVANAVNAFAVLAAGTGSAELMAAGAYGIGSMPLATLMPGAGWTPRNGPDSVSAGGSNLRLNNVSVWDTAVLGTTLYAAVAANHYRDVLASADGGATWASTGSAAVLSSSDIPTRLLADSANGVLYVGTTQGLLAYTPATTRWSAVGTPAIGSVSALALGSTSVFVGTDTDLYAVRRSAAPATATPASTGLTGVAIKALLVGGGAVYAGTLDTASDTYAVVSAGESAASAGGTAWTAFGAGPVGNRVTSLLLVDSVLLAGTNGGLVRYASATSPWASANVAADPAQQIADAFGVVNALFTDGVTIYAATGNGGVFTAPYGTSFAWSASSNVELPSLEVRSLRASGSTLYAATRAGVATFAGITPSAEPPPPPPPGDGSSGGGAFSLPYAVALLLAIRQLRRRRAR